MNFGMEYTGGDMSVGGGFGGGGDGGGFSGGGGGGGGSQPQSAQKQRKKYDEQTLIPVTCRMIINSLPAPNSGDGTGSLSLAEPDGRELYQVKLIGAVRSVDGQSTNVKYEIEDGTGLVEVQQWIDDNDCQAVNNFRDEIMNNDGLYVKIIGQVKDYDNKKSITAYSVRKIDTYNEFVHHMLDVVYSSEKHKKADTIVGGSSMMNMGGGSMMNSPGGAGAGIGFGQPIQQQSHHGMGNMQQQTGGGDSNNNNLQELVLNYIRTEGDMSDQGASIDGCIQDLNNKGGSNFTSQDVQAAVEQLCSEGHIYSTINENWYKYAM